MNCWLTANLKSRDDDNLNLNQVQNHENIQWPYIQHLEVQIHLKIHLTLKTVHLQVSKGSLMYTNYFRFSNFFAVNRKLFWTTIFFLFASFLHKVCTCPSKKRNEILPKIFGQAGARKHGRRLKLRRGRNLFQDKSLHWAEITSSRSEIIQFFMKGVI